MTRTQDFGLNRRASDIVFNEKFLNATQVGRNGGTIYGNPVIKNGIGEFDGTTDRIVYDKKNIIGDFTLNVKFRTSVDATDVIVSTTDGTVANGFLFNTVAGGNIQYRLCTNSGNRSLTTTGGGYDDGEWHYATCSAVSGSMLYLWIDGVLAASGSIGVVKDTAVHALSIGDHPAGGFPYTGSVDTVEIINRALTLQEHNDWRTGQTYNYMNKAVLNLPMHDKIGSAAPFYTSNVGKDVTALPGLVDGNMEASGVSDWTAYSGATLTKETTTPHGGLQCLRVADAAGSVAATQPVLTTGTAYRITGWARGDGSSTKPAVWKQGSQVWTGTTSNTWQYFDETFVATGITLYLYKILVGDGYAEFDDVNITTLNGATLGDGSTASTFPTKLTHRNGYSFDGGDSLNVGTSPLYLKSATDMSVEMWLYVDTNDFDGSVKVIADSSTLSVGSGGGFYIAVDDRGATSPTNGIRIHYRRTSGNTILYSNNNVFSSGLYHLVFITGTGEAGKIYVNGINETLSLTPGVTGDYIPKNDNLYIGSANDGTYGYTNEIYKTRLYSSVLTPTQIKDLYNKGSKYLGNN